MRAMIVVESCYGSTWEIAQAIADGLGGADVVRAADMPAVGADVELLLVGAPTHNMHLPSPSSREQAAKRAEGCHCGGAGVREWIDALPAAPAARIVTFDTCVPNGTLLGRAAKDAAKRLRRVGANVIQGETFWMQGTKLRAGELERARAWGGSLK